MRSFWSDGLAVTPRPPLHGDTETDVVIVGAGFTGLWTAYYLRELDPGRRVLVIDANHAGAGASGRNGGWCSAELPVGLGTLARRYGRQAAVAMQRAARGAVQEVGRVAAQEHIDCGWSPDGTIRLARSQPQRDRLEALRAEEHAFGLDGWRTMDPRELAVPGLRAAAYSPHCAAVQPARLVHGLADAVVRRGGEIVESTRALELRPGLVRTDRGQIRAQTVIRATEAYTSALPGRRRQVLPLTSQVIATAPIAEELWNEIGWPGRATMADLRLAFPYLHRTTDDRLVIGGRWIGYRFGSLGATDPRVWDLLHREIAQLFPALAGIAVSHRWSGILGAHRSWEPRVSYDPATGLASGGGYVGDGVALSNLAGRTLAALVAGSDRPETRLCWVGPPPRRWEPEPLRFLAVRSLARLARWVDAYEQRTDRSAGLRGRLVAAVTS